MNTIPENDAPVVCISCLRRFRLSQLIERRTPPHERDDGSACTETDYVFVPTEEDVFD
jgi:hypothetical protein